MHHYNNKKILTSVITLALATQLSTGCLLAAGAVGAEGGYIAIQDTRTAGEVVDDQLIHTALKTKLLADPAVSGLSINVDVHQRNVQLRGYVKSQFEIDRAVHLARQTKGVKSVESRLILDRP
jgi:hyperosmotically inducible protein